MWQFALVLIPMLFDGMVLKDNGELVKLNIDCAARKRAAVFD